MTRAGGPASPSRGSADPVRRRPASTIAEACAHATLDLAVAAPARRRLAAIAACVLARRGSARSGVRTGSPHAIARRASGRARSAFACLLRRRAPFALAAGLWGAGAACAGGQPTTPEPPARVVSINLCTDQLALMLADEGQLVSVSHLAQDPRSSPMAEAARRLTGNAARAEEVYLMRPDLVLAGRFTSRATIDMLRRLGVPVTEFDPAYSLVEITDRLAAMGRALGREAEAGRMIAGFEADLAAISADAAERPRAALYYANGYTGGERSLAGEIVTAAGFANIAAELGLTHGGRVALERLILAAPDLVVTGQRHPGASRAEAVLDHPALATLNAGRGAMTDRDWVCGTPHVLAAIRDMARLRAGLDSPAAPGHDPADPTGEPQ